MTTGARPDVRVVEVGEQDALRLLAGVRLGRVVFTHRALPAIRPVNHIVHDGRVVIRSRTGTALLKQAVLSGVVAYEADEIDPRSHTGWSVILTGVATVVRDEALVDRYRTVLRPWIDQRADTFVSIRPGMVTAYRIVPAP
ncbi:pyridoxamine 5'-phosphate oxidase family protein [Streptomyces sp. NPDC018031]|uniref:pyridoxamine 5'-phosphate oxidase family protein n=1 Tax=Streptomyces sp. NPDC018031 TaxID=3365033 RepID=UPI0037B7F175